MRLQPIAGWWLLTICILGGLGYVGYYGVREYQKHKRVAPANIRRVTMLLCLLLMVLGISIPGGTTSPGVANLDVVFAVDTTASMGALDYNGETQRLTGVKNDITAIGKKLNGAHFSVVTFDSNVETIMPSTADYNTLAAVTQSLTPEIYNTSNGSSIDLAVDQLEQQLSSSKAAYPDRNRLLFFMTDGEQTSKKPVKSFEKLQKYLNAGAVLGYGTAKGAKMVKFTGLGQDDKTVAYVSTPDPATKKFVPAISKMDESNLKKVSEQLRLTYVNRNQPASVDKLIEDARVNLAIDKSRHVTHYINIYWLFAIPFTLLLLWEYRRLAEEALKAERAYRAHKKEQSS